MWFSKVEGIIDKYITIVGNGGAVIGVLAMWVVAVTSSLEVVVRSGFGHAFTDVVTIGRICMLMMGFLPAAYALRLNRHISVTFVTERLPDKVARWVNLIGSVICLCMLGLMIVITSRYTLTSWELESVLITSWGEPPMWMFQCFVPLGLLILGIQLMLRIAANFRIIINKESDCGDSKSATI